MFFKDSFIPLKGEKSLRITKRNKLTIFATINMTYA